MRPLEPPWRAPWSYALPHVPQALLPWLWEGHSMTQRLAHYSNALSIQLLEEKWALPRHSECRNFDVPPQLAWVRTITMNDGHTPWLAARSVIPSSACHQSGGRLLKLGTSALGAFVFSDPQTQRQQLQWAQIKPIHHDYRWLQSLHPQPYPYYWARRSVILWQQQPIIVNEYFLPALLNMASLSATGPR